MPSASVDTETKRDDAVISDSAALGVTTVVEVLFISYVTAFRLVSQGTHPPVAAVSPCEGVTTRVLVIGAAAEVWPGVVDGVMVVVVVVGCTDDAAALQ